MKLSKSLRKVLFLGLATIMVASTGASLNQVNVNARHIRHHRVHQHYVRKHRSYWHYGTPGAMRGSWKSYTRQYHSYSGRLHVSRSDINQTHKYAPMDPMDIIKLHYHYLGHDQYLIKGHDQNQGITSKRNEIFHFNLKRHHRAYFSGIRHGKFGDQGIYVKY